MAEVIRHTPFNNSFKCAFQWYLIMKTCDACCCGGGYMNILTRTWALSIKAYKNVSPQYLKSKKRWITGIILKSHEKVSLISCLRMNMGLHSWHGMNWRWKMFESQIARHYNIRVQFLPIFKTNVEHTF